ncbi:hypothetical protein CW304_17725 [Bacillus sp. UFRGS-B20]|nr:hypothetical protein CW304_17725 [Bacillus sp. UFRGS-B20]
MSRMNTIKKAVEMIHFYSLLIDFLIYQPSNIMTLDLQGIFFNSNKRTTVLYPIQQYGDRKNKAMYIIWAVFHTLVINCKLGVLGFYAFLKLPTCGLFRSVLH